MTAALKGIWGLLTPVERRRALALLGFMLIGTLLEAAGIGLMIPLIALLTQPDIADRYPAFEPALALLGYPTQRALILGAMLALTVIYTVKNFFLVFLALREARFVSDVQAELSRRLFRTYLRQPYAFHLRHNSAVLIHNATGVVSSFVYSAMTPALVAVAESLTLIGVAGLAILVEPLGVLLVALVLGGAGLGFHKLTRARIARWGEAYEHHQGLRMQHLAQGLAGAKVVKLSGREDSFLGQFHLHNIQSARMEGLQVGLQHIPRLWLELLAVSGLATLVLTMVLRGHDMDTVLPTVGFLSAAAYRLMPSVNRILGAAQAIRYSTAAVATLTGELSRTSLEPESPRRQGLLPFQQRVQLTNVSYSYAGATIPALTEVSLHIDKGETVGVVGPSGAGKSTMVDVLLGLLTPTSGRVMVDGQDVQQDLRGWQDQVGYVPQSIYLTDDTLRRNVAFGLTDDQIDNEGVRAALLAAQLEDFVNRLPDGIETLVGERGVRLSGGERQRIGIARALYHDPAVLVLDEATSSLDAAAERGVMAAVESLHGRKTILIVSHRLTTVQQCDRLYRLVDGRVAAVGKPAEAL